jgi:hypothetical protein
MQINNLESNLILFSKRQNKRIQSCLNVTKTLASLLRTILASPLSLFAFTRLIAWGCVCPCVFLPKMSAKKKWNQDRCWSVCTIFYHPISFLFSLLLRTYIGASWELNYQIVFSFAQFVFSRVHGSLRWQDPSLCSLNWMVEITPELCLLLSWIKFRISNWAVWLQLTLICSSFPNTEIINPWYWSSVLCTGSSKKSCNQ